MVHAGKAVVLGGVWGAEQKDDNGEEQDGLRVPGRNAVARVPLRGEVSDGAIHTESESEEEEWDGQDWRSKLALRLDV